MTKRNKVRVDTNIVVRVVANGAIAGQVRDGAALPVLVVDATTLPEIADAIRAAEFEPDGDVRTIWSRERRTGAPFLEVELIRPVPVRFVIAFEIPEQALLIDTTLEARSFYLKAGGPDATFESTFADPSIIVDVPPTEFNASWPGMYKRILMDQLRRDGLPVRAARSAADAAYDRLRMVSTFRIPQVGSDTEEPQQPG